MPYFSVYNLSLVMYSQLISKMQLRICVECAFGMLVQSWGILRMVLSSRLSLSKIVALVTALAKLHNYCIQSRTDSIDNDTLIYLKSDEDKIFTNENGYVAVNKSKNNYSCPDLIGGEEHFHNIPKRSFRHPKTNSIFPVQFCIKWLLIQIKRDRN